MNVGSQVRRPSLSECVRVCVCVCVFVFLIFGEGPGGDLRAMWV